MKGQLIQKVAMALKALDSERKELSQEVNDLSSELKKFAAAKDLTFKLWKMGSFPAEDIQENLESLLNKPLDDLTTMDKVAHMMPTNRGQRAFSVGKLSESPLPIGSAEDRFIATLFD